MGIDEKLIEEIVNRILNVVRPDRIILFGTAATGSMTRDSDIDLLVLKASVDDVRRERVNIRRSLQEIDYPFDIIVMSTEWFEESKDIIGGVAYPAHKYGTVIYEAA